MASMKEVTNTVTEVDILVRMLINNPRISSITDPSLQKEKQIMVDPLSLKDSSIKQECLEKATVLPSLQPPKQKFLSLSLPNSVNSSPRSNKASNLTNKHRNLLQGVHLGKSKSCGEGRECEPLEEFDHWLTKLSAKENDDKWQWNHSNFTKTEAVKESPKNVKHMKKPDDGFFKCSALCLYLPSFVGKVKQVKTRKEVEAAMSRTVSLEKFECGSWASAAAIFHDSDGDSNNSYFDLPMELIHCSASEVYSPIAATFVYEKELKGALKNGSSRASARKSDTSPRQVRFSVSSSASNPASPTSCFSPRLIKAREDFNAFLAAQSA